MSINNTYLFVQAVNTSIAINIATWQIESKKKFISSVQNYLLTSHYVRATVLSIGFSHSFNCSSHKT